MIKSDSRAALEDIVLSLKRVFKDYDRGSRAKAWKAIQTGKGKEIVDSLLVNPSRPIIGLPRLLHFKEWLLDEALRPEDQQYAQRWLSSRAPGTVQAIKQNIEQAAATGEISLFVDINGITDEDKGRLSAYRVIANQIGFEIGQWRYDRSKGTGSAHAPIARSSPNPRL